MNIARLLAANWKASTIALLMLSLVGGCTALWVQRDHALIAKGKAEERARVADSTLAATAKPIAHAETLVVYRTRVVPQLIARVDSLRDTLRISDTVQVREYVTRTDSALKACSELVGDCAEFRRLADIRFAAYEAKLAAIPAAAPPRSCTMSNVVWAAIGTGGGFLLGRR